VFVGRLKWFLITLGPIVAVLLSMFCAVPAGAEPVPAQKIVVSSPSAGSPTGTLTAYEQAGSGWRVVLGPTRADLGELGVGSPQDSVFRTPTGTYSLGQAFGRQPNPGTRMPYFQTNSRDWWDEDVNSPTYNTHVESNDKPSSDAENLYNSGYIYDYAVLIEHNSQRKPGRQAGIFLHVTNGAPTWGCVAVGREEMRRLLTWLDPAANPKITIDVGAAAPASA
jgi:L,D-peptidoglycan transpeptidase YkuD (ErfK/YbiS/YcfS/YnhG family)